MRKKDNMPLALVVTLFAIVFSIGEAYGTEYSSYEELLQNEKCERMITSNRDNSMLSISLGNCKWCLFDAMNNGFQRHVCMPPVDNLRNIIEANKAIVAREFYRRVKEEGLSKKDLYTEQDGIMLIFIEDFDNTLKNIKLGIKEGIY